MRVAQAGRVIASTATRRRRGVLSVLTAVVLAAGLLTGCTASSGPGHAFSLQSVGAAQSGQVYPVSKRVPVGSYAGALLDSKPFALSSLRGHVTVLSWWASWCGPCQVEMPQYDVLYRKLAPQGVRFVGFDIKDDRDSAEAFVKNYDISYPIVYDEPGKSTVSLGVGSISGPPFTMLVDKQGKVAAVYLGRQADVSLSQAIGKLQS